MDTSSERNAHPAKGKGAGGLSLLTPTCTKNAHARYSTSLRHHNFRDITVTWRYSAFFVSPESSNESIIDE